MSSRREKPEINEIDDEKRDRWIMAEGILNLLTAAIGIIIMLLLIVLLISLVDWLIGDITGSRFAVLLERFR